MYLLQAEEKIKDILPVDMTPLMQLQLLHPKARIPTCEASSGAGYNLFAVEKTIIEPYAVHAQVRLGIALELPHGVEMEIRGCSDINTTTGLRVVPAAVDRDYRGEVMVIFDNLSDNAYTIKPGLRVAQGVFKYVAIPVLVPTFVLSDSERRVGGVGATGQE
jgi:dUTP pyrophosphatase